MSSLGTWSDTAAARIWKLMCFIHRVGDFSGRYRPPRRPRPVIVQDHHGREICRFARACTMIVHSIDKIHVHRVFLGQGLTMTAFRWAVVRLTSTLAIIARVVDLITEVELHIAPHQLMVQCKLRAAPRMRRKLMTSCREHGRLHASPHDVHYSSHHDSNQGSHHVSPHRTSNQGSHHGSHHSSPHSSSRGYAADSYLRDPHYQ